MVEDVTLLLYRYRIGEKDAEARLLEAVYSELKRIARSQLRNGSGNQTLQPTALVNEAYFKLAGTPSRNWSDRKHFFRVAACAMRQVVIDHARANAATRRGGDLAPLPIDERVLATKQISDDLFALSQALNRLRKIEHQTYRVVQLRFLLGLSVEETATRLSVSPRTVKRQWRRGREWLKSALTGTANVTSSR